MTPRELTQAEIARIAASPEKQTANASLFIGQLLGHIAALDAKLGAKKPKPGSPSETK